jgi:cyanophycinase
VGANGNLARMRAVVALLALICACGTESSPLLPSGGGGEGGMGAGGASAGGMEAGGAGGGAGGGETREPTKPDALVHYLTGNDADAAVDPTGPALILMGGGPEVDQAFFWWQEYLQGGDVVVLRVSGADGYNGYLYDEIGGVDSVETMLVTTKALASDPYVRFRIEHAEGIFIAGGNQASYVNVWKGTAVEDAIHAAYARGAVIGGTSAGLAILGQFVFSAQNGTVYSDEALDNPYNQYMTLDQGFLELPLLAGVITDSHFAERDRFGRLLGFTARIVEDGWANEAMGIGVDETTALLVAPNGSATVEGVGNVYVLKGGAPTQCVAGQPLEHSVSYHVLTPGDSIALPGGTTTVPSQIASAAGGALTPANPY